MQFPVDLDRDHVVQPCPSGVDVEESSIHEGALKGERLWNNFFLQVLLFSEILLIVFSFLFAIVPGA